MCWNKKLIRLENVRRLRGWGVIGFYLFSMMFLFLDQRLNIEQINREIR